MSAPHWYPFYVHDWLNDHVVQEMTWAQRGFYHHMLTVSWLQNPPGTLPAKRSVLCRVLGIEMRTFRSYFCDVLATRWVREGDKLINLKLFEIGQKQLKTLSERKKAGKEGGLAKARNLLQQNSSKPSSNQSQRQNQNQISESEASYSPLNPPKGEAMEWIELFNTLTGTNLRGSKEHLRVIKKRIEAGFTIEDAKAVIVSKQAKWGHDPAMSEYIRIETLFGPKFETYLSQSNNHQLSKSRILEATHYFTEAKTKQPHRPDEDFYLSVRSKYGPDIERAVKTERAKIHAEDNGNAT